LNFDFIPMPNFVNLKKKGEIEKMFKTYNWNEASEAEGPTFICMYVGDRSANLDLGKSNLKDDAKNLTDDVGLENSELSLPSGGVIVRYGQPNQSVFKNLKLNQKEFSETDGTLRVTDSLTNPNSINSGSFMGQSLFNVYSKRSYTCSFDMLGNVMMQPMMYFHLENIPMFKGTYLITKVSHSVTPNNIETHVKGVRVSKYDPPLLTEGTVYLDMIGSIKRLTKFTTKTLTQVLEDSENDKVIKQSSNEINNGDVIDVISLRDEGSDLNYNDDNNFGVIYV